MLLVLRNEAGRLFQTRAPATTKLLSPNWVLIRGTTREHSTDKEG